MTDKTPVDLDALSERVAGMMGWRKLNDSHFGWERAPLRALYPQPSYASDWSLLPEMLAWLRERITDTLKIEEFIDGHVTAWLFGSAFVTGETLPEAVARLVVAVAERERKEEQP